MTDAQMYFAVGVPVFAIVISMVAGILQMHGMGGRFTGMEARLTSIETTMNGRFTSIESTMNARFNSIENRLTSMDARFETLTGKVIEIDNRLTRVEAILDRH